MSLTCGIRPAEVQASAQTGRSRCPDLDMVCLQMFIIITIKAKCLHAV